MSPQLRCAQIALRDGALIHRHRDSERQAEHHEDSDCQPGMREYAHSRITPSLLKTSQHAPSNA